MSVAKAGRLARQPPHVLLLALLRPAWMGFGALRVINEDRVAPGAGFAPHRHANMEILSYVLEGALAHRDDSGGGGVIRAGELQWMSAGHGIEHSEYNGSDSEPVHFLQIWIQPDRLNATPAYAQRARVDSEADRGTGWCWHHPMAQTAASASARTRGCGSRAWTRAVASSTRWIRRDAIGYRSCVARSRRPDACSRPAMRSAWKRKPVTLAAVRADGLRVAAVRLAVGGSQPKGRLGRCAGKDSVSRPFPSSTDSRPPRCPRALRRVEPGRQSKFIAARPTMPAYASRRTRPP